MTEHTEQDARRSLRESLIVQGFERTGYSDDFDATGRYQEWWSRGEDRVTIAWGRRVVQTEPPEHEQQMRTQETT